MKNDYDPFVGMEWSGEMLTKTEPILDTKYCSFKNEIDRDNEQRINTINKA